MADSDGAVYTSVRPDGSERDGMTRAQVEAEYASAAQNYVDNGDWGEVLDENGFKCRIIMRAELVEG